MTNPNDAIGTPAAYDGRGSVNGYGDPLGLVTARGIVSGWNCRPKSGMTVQIGGQSAIRDVAIAEDNANNRVTINNRSAAPVDLTISAAPSTNNRIDAIVAYVDQPATGDSSTSDNPDACGIIVVKGTVAASPSAPTEAQIRTAITSDGATGSSAYYVVLATIRVGTNVSTIGSGVITQGTVVKLGTDKLPAIGHDQIDFSGIVKLLWTNANPTNTFAAQNVNISGLSGYTFIGIIFCTHTSQQANAKMVIARYSDGGATLESANNSNTIDRESTFTSSQVQFSDGRLNATTDNDRAIPKAIYGFKF